MTTRPGPTEAAPYYFTYIDQVPEGDLCEILETGGSETLALFRGISEPQSLHRYAPGKWSIRDVANHITDYERLFVARAFWFARGHHDPLPGFDQDVAAAVARADDRPWERHVEEFQTVRAATLTFFRSLPLEAWSRRGLASGHPFTVRALAYAIAGHAVHHTKVLRERYLPPNT